MPASSRQRIPAKKKRKSKPAPGVSVEQQARLLIAAVQPLLAFFAELDDVFTEDGALMPEYRKISLGRCYEAWQRCRKEFDPDFVAADYRRARVRGPMARRRT